jgi:hypothetical protein
MCAALFPDFFHRHLRSLRRLGAKPLHSGQQIQQVW